MITEIEKLNENISNRRFCIAISDHELYCQYCGKPIFLIEHRTFAPRDWDCFKPCDHVIFIYDELNGFLKVRSDYGKLLIEYLLQSEEKVEQFLEYAEEISDAIQNVYLPFARGEFRCQDMIGYRVGNLLMGLPQVKYPDAIPRLSTIYHFSYTIGKHYVGGINNSRSVYVAINPDVGMLSERNNAKVLWAGGRE